MAAVLKAEFGTDAELIPGSHGIFEVKHGERIVWTNRDTGGLPDPATVADAFRALKQ